MNLYPIENFEYRLIEQHIGGWYLAPMLARLVVSVKFMTGVFLILNINPKNLLPKLLLPVLLLHLFDIFWIYQNQDAIMYHSYTSMVRGDFAELSGMGATAVLLILVVLMFLKPRSTDLRFWWFKYPAGLTLLVLPFILNAIFPYDLKDIAEHTNERLKTEVVTSPTLDSLAQGDVLVGFFSTSCPYCLNAARKIKISQKRWPENFPPFFICFLGQKGSSEYFLSVANIDFPFQALDREQYYQLSDGRFPKFALVKNGVIKKRLDGRSFNYYTLNELSKGNY